MPSYRRVVVEHDVAVPMRDGTELLADIYAPDGPGLEQVDTHRLSRGFRIVFADRTIDVVMLLGGIFEIGRPL